MFYTANTSLVVTPVLPTRCLASVPGCKGRNLFSVGTCSVSSNNELHFIEYDGEANSLISRGAASYPYGEINSMAFHPNRNDLVAICSRSGNCEHIGSIVKIDFASKLPPIDGSDPEKISSDSVVELNQVVTLSNDEKNSGGPLRKMIWHPNDDDDVDENISTETNASGEDAKSMNERFVSLYDGAMRLWDLSDSGLENIGECFFSECVGRRVHSGSWDPHHINEVSLARGGSIETVDLRSLEVTRKIENAHGSAIIHDIDYNPNKPYYLVSGGEDKNLKFWDLRKQSSPVRVMTDVHAHWVCNAQYNPFHDQLVLSSGSDALSALYRVSSISSAPFLHTDPSEIEHDKGETQKDNDFSDYDFSNNEFPSIIDDATHEIETEDALIKVYEDHDDSVYGLAWSGCDAWVFATLSYDSKLVVNFVPSVEKYKILL